MCKFYIQKDIFYTKILHMSPKNCTFVADLTAYFMTQRLIHRCLMACQLVAAAVLSCGCHVMEKKQQAGAAVEVHGQYLYRSTLDSLTLGMSPEDSTKAVQQYISQWAKDILMYDRAKGRSNASIERLVEDYRRTLYMHAYEEYLVEKRMPKTVTDSAVAQLYARMPDRFILSESIVRGLLVIVPSDAPNIQKLRNWMSKRALDEIEKYAYQNANGYQLFMDRWLTTSDLLAQLPVDRAEFENRLRYRDQIEVADSLKTYILQVTDKHLRGEGMPMDYARPEIEKILLYARQAEFLQKERDKLYNEAIQKNQIVFY